MIRAGTATVDITPAPGSLMAAFPRRPDRTPRRAEGAHDPLNVRVLYLESEAETVALCAADVISFDQVDVDRIRRTAGEILPQLNGPRLILAASHTHSGPETSYMFGNTEDDPYIHSMCARIADAVIAAHAAMVPVNLRVGRTRAELAHNRRVTRNGTSTMVFDYDPAVTTGPSDPGLPVIRLDRNDGTPLAVVYNFAAHALTVGPDNLFYTADFPGVASRIVEARYPGCTALFLNGAAGNQHPRRSMHADFAVTENCGGALAEHVIAAAELSKPVDDPEFNFAAEHLRVPNRVRAGHTVDLELCCFKLGPVTAAVMPGEPFVEFQLDFKRAVAPDIGMFVGYANGGCGYVPTRAAYDEGGYGVAAYAEDPPGRERTAVPAGTGETALERLIAMASALE